MIKLQRFIGLKNNKYYTGHTVSADVAFFYHIKHVQLIIHVVQYISIFVIFIIIYASENRDIK
jgi:hypothetical protein